MADSQTKQPRDSRIELLRIIAMLLIVTCHYAAGMGLTKQQGWSGAVATLLEQNGQVGVTVYFAITGYYLVDRPFSKSRIIRLWAQVYTYSVLVFILCLALNAVRPIPTLAFRLHGSEGIRTCLKTFLPVLSGEYWFVSAYIVMLILAPVINRVLRESPRKILLIGIVCLAVAPSLALVGFQGVWPVTQPIYAITCYMIGGYLRLYPAVSNRRRAALTIPAAVIFCLAVPLLVDRATQTNQPIARFFAWSAQGYKTLTCQIVIGTCMMVLAIHRQSRPWSSKVINAFSATTLGIYLIHAHYLGKSALWYIVPRLVPGTSNAVARIAVHGLAIIVIFALLSLGAFIMDKLVVRHIQTLVSRLALRGPVVSS